MIRFDIQNEKLAVLYYNRKTGYFVCSKDGWQYIPIAGMYVFAQSMKLEPLIDKMISICFGDKKLVIPNNESIEDMKYIISGRRIKVMLEGKEAGSIKKTKEGWRYFPKGKKERGEAFDLLFDCQLSLMPEGTKLISK